MINLRWKNGELQMRDGVHWQYVPSVSFVEEKEEELKEATIWDCHKCQKAVWDDYCGSCGAKRPEAPAKKKLAEVIGHSLGIVTDYVKRHNSDDVVLDYVLEKIDEWHEENIEPWFGERIRILKEYLKREAL